MLTEDEFVMLYYNLPLCPTLDRSANTIRPRSEESDGTIHLLIGRMCCRPRDRDSLQRLCRYIARPAVSNERLSVNDRAQVVDRLKHPFGDSTTLASSRGSIGVWCTWSVTAIGCARDSATS